MPISLLRRTWGSSVRHGASRRTFPTSLMGTGLRSRKWACCTGFVPVLLMSFSTYWGGKTAASGFTVVEASWSLAATFPDLNKRLMIPVDLSGAAGCLALVWMLMDPIRMLKQKHALSQDMLDDDSHLWLRGLRRRDLKHAQGQVEDSGAQEHMPVSGIAFLASSRSTDLGLATP